MIDKEKRRDIKKMYTDPKVQQLLDANDAMSANEKPESVGEKRARLDVSEDYTRTAMSPEYMEKLRLQEEAKKKCHAQHWDGEECNCSPDDPMVGLNYVHVCIKPRDEQGNCTCYKDLKSTTTISGSFGNTDEPNGTNYTILDPDNQDDKDWFQEMLDKPLENPFDIIEIEPEWYGVSDACHDFAIAILSGFIWEAENTTNFHSFFPKMAEIKALLHEFTWLKKIGEEDSEQYWPGEDEKLRLAFVKFAMMIPNLWD